MSAAWLLRWGPRLFLAVGVALLVVAAVMAVLEVRFLADAERAPGTVIDFSRETDSEGDVSFYPVVRFTSESGETIQFVSNTSSSSGSVGDEVEVLYDADDPRDAKLSDFFSVWGLPVIFGFIGVCFSAVALFWLGLTRRRLGQGDEEWLRANGVRMQGRSPRVVESMVSVAGSSPFRIEVDVHDPLRNEVRVLTSEELWFNPAPYLDGRAFLDVYVDPSRPKRYYVDVSFLPRLADS